MEDTVARKPSVARLVGWIALAVVVITAVIYLTVFRINRFQLLIQLEGTSEITVEYGTQFVDPGTSVWLQGSLFLKDGSELTDVTVSVLGEVDDEVLGTYTLTYTAEYQGLQASTERTVHIIDTTPPVITLVTGTKQPEEDAPYEEEGFSAVDNHDGDLTAAVQRQELYGVIIYTVEDSSGNTASVERTIPFYDPIPPTIILEGEMYYSVTVGSLWEDPGFVAVDNVAGDLTEQTLVEGQVDRFQPGLYYINYTATDTHGNHRTATRLVEVVAAERPQTVMPEGRVIYLTFDDGPGPYTQALLDVLAKYGVKATFFVKSGDYNYVMKEIVRQGHSIGIHSVTHNYEKIYASPDAYFADLLGMQEIIYRNTGVRTTLMRFPGGSSNLVSARVSKGIMTMLTQTVQDAGFQYFDWNVSSGDAGETDKTREVYANVIEGIRGNRVSVVLQHDIHAYSVDAVEDIIIWGLENGYTFLPLEPTSPGFHHPVFN